MAHMSRALRFKRYFDHAMRRYDVSPESAEVAWIAAERDKARAYRCYKFIYLTDRERGRAD